MHPAAYCRTASSWVTVREMLALSMEVPMDRTVCCWAALSNRLWLTGISVLAVCQVVGGGALPAARLRQSERRDGWDCWCCGRLSGTGAGGAPATTLAGRCGAGVGTASRLAVLRRWGACELGRRCVVAEHTEHPDEPANGPAADPTGGASGPVDPGANAAGPDSPAPGGGRRSRAARGRARDPRGDAAAEVDAVMAKRHRVVAVRLTELEHLGWRRAAAADKRGQVGAWVRSVVAAELTRRQGADVPSDGGDEAAAAGPGVRIVLNDGVVRELSQQLVRVGSNLNQVTRLAHIEARSSGLDNAGLGRVVAVIDQTRATIAALDSRLEAMSSR